MDLKGMCKLGKALEYHSVMEVPIYRLQSEDPLEFSTFFKRQLMQSLQLGLREGRYFFPFC